MLVHHGHLLDAQDTQPKLPTMSSFSERVFLQWQAFIEAEVGFVLPKNQTHWFWHTLMRVAKVENLSPVDLLHRASMDKALAQRVIDAVLIPQTRFFRHPTSHSFILSQVTERYQASKKEETAYIWSVGCSYGQEAWSIALSLFDANLSFELWGSDVNKTALTYAKEAKYDMSHLEDIPFAYHALLSIPENSKGTWAPHQTIQKKVHFFHHNIFKSEILDIPAMDVIVCQNVLIYFRQFDQRDILRDLMMRLNIGGVLVLAPGEAGFWHHPCMQKVRQKDVNAWRKVKNSE